MSENEFETLDLVPGGCRRRHRLQRLRAGELQGAEADTERAHLAGCAACQRTWRELEAEDAEVRAAVPLATLEARFAAKPAAQVIRPSRWKRAIPGVSLALAAGLAALVLVPRVQHPERNGTKGGGAGLDVFVGGVGEPRRVEGEVALGPGEAVRLKVQPGGHPYIAVVAVDENGEVDPLYFDAGASLKVGSQAQLLPQSIVFDGRGRERLIVLYSDAPLARDEVTRAARDAFRTAGGLDRMGRLGLGSEEIDRVVRKPEGQ